MRFVVFVTAWLLVLAVSARPEIGRQGDPVVRDALGLSDWTLQEITATPDAQGQVVFRMALDGYPYTIVLAPHSVRAQEFRVLAEEAGGAFAERPTPPMHTYRGTVAEMPGSRVAASLTDGRLSAMIFAPSAPDDRIWTIQPLSDVYPTAPASLCVVYDGADVRLPEARCGVETEPKSEDGVGIADTGLKLAEIAFDADYELYTRLGSDVNRVVDDIEKVMNGIEVIYERDVGIAYEIGTVVVRISADDPYTSTDSGTRLGEFRNDWNTNHRDIRRDIAHLMTGADLDGNIIGLAWVGVVCSSIVNGYGYALSQTLWTTNLNGRVTLTAHEIGHSWNAGHCDGDGDCHIMCGGIGGCDGWGLPHFGAAAKNAIAAHRDSRSCLIDLAAPIEPPFTDEFPASPPDTAKWIYVNNAAVTYTAINEPSPPYSLALDSLPSEYGQDEIRSNKIRLSGLSTPRVSFYSEHRGVEAGESLILEYWYASYGEWWTLATLTSDGVDQEQFVYHEYMIPQFAISDQFRLRFRVVGNESDDDWYIDDVSVTGQPIEADFTGHVELKSYAGGAGRTATMEWRWAGTSYLVHSAPVTLDADGDFLVRHVPIGTYDVAVKFPNWLRQVVLGVTVAYPSGHADFVLENGDANGDNAVDLADLNLVLSNFGASGGGDLDWDGVADLRDINIILSAFGLQGDD